MATIHHSKRSKILAVYIEPTPYIMGLIDALRKIWHDEVDVLFLCENRSQNWQITLDENCIMLPKSAAARFHIISKLFFRNDYNLMHLAGWGNPLLLLCLMLTKIFRKPIVAESDTPIPHHTKLWKRIIKRLTYPTFFKLFNLFCPGGARQAKYFEYYGVKSERIIPVQMTVDIAGMRQYVKTLNSSNRRNWRVSYGIEESNIVFLYVGRLVEHKGLTDLISAFCKVENKDVRLLIVGDGPMRQQIEDVVRDNKKICYAGRLIDKELVENFCAADVLVLPSHVEPWGLVVNEAMAVGLPVIVSDRVGCIDDLVVHNETGIIVEAQNVCELQRAIEVMSGCSKKRSAMGRQAEIKISDWTLENEAKKICQAWHQLLS